MVHVMGAPLAACLLRLPLSFSYAQITGGDSPKKADPRCFIATAAFGSPLAEELNYLRWFRDEYLLRSTIGKLLVETYYTYSPYFAEKISRSPRLASWTRKALTPIVEISKYIYTSTEEKNCRIAKKVCD